MPNAFYTQVDARTFLATPATAGPWDGSSQHGGPPSALLARAIERHEPDADQRLARVSVDILRPIPLGELTVTTRTLRPGRRITLVEAVLSAGAEHLAHGRGWRIARAASPQVTRAAPVPPIPGGPPPPLPGFWENEKGYLAAIEWRFVSGGFGNGPARAWTRPRIPLIDGELQTPMSRALLVADSGSGVSAELDPTRYLFINTDVTVALSRDPDGEWLLLESATEIGPDGTGRATTTLYDTGGACGTGLQTLLVAPRSAGPD